MTRLGRLFGKKKRPVVLHFHIFKNAGTTIDFILKQNFGKRLVHLHGDRFDSSLSNPEVLTFLEQHPDVAAISSHHLRPPKPASEDFTFLDVIVLREPLDRLCSIYDFYGRSDQQNDPLTKPAKSMQLGEFIRFLESEYPHLVKNPQLNFVANGGGAIPNAQDLQRGTSLAMQAAILGVTELMDQCLVTAEFALGEELGKIDFSYLSQNVTLDRGRKAASDRLREACGEKFYNEICEAHALDSELHRCATEEANRRFRAIPDRERRLADFRARCQQHERNAEMITAASNHPHNFVKYLS